MTPYDDADLIAGLRSGIAECESGVAAPERIGDDARRTARRRSATRVLAAGVPVLAAAGVTTVLISDAGSPSSAGRGSGAIAHPASPVSGGPVESEDAAYVVRRVTARLAGPRDMVLDLTQYTGGRLRADGSLVDRGWRSGEEYQYTAPDGTVYQRQLSVGRSGRTWLAGDDVVRRGVHGTRYHTYSDVDYRNHTFDEGRRGGGLPSFAGGPPPSLQSSPSQVRRELHVGRVTLLRRTTVHGLGAIALSVRSDGYTQILYVDARTYEPLRMVAGGAFIADWLPATPANVAMVKNASIPAGYTRVAHVG